DTIPLHSRIHPGPLHRYDGVPFQRPGPERGRTGALLSQDSKERETTNPTNRTNKTTIGSYSSDSWDSWFHSLSDEIFRGCCWRGSATITKISRMTLPWAGNE